MPSKLQRNGIITRITEAQPASDQLGLFCLESTQLLELVQVLPQPPLQAEPQPLLQLEPQPLLQLEPQPPPQAQTVAGGLPATPASPRPTMARVGITIFPAVTKNSCRLILSVFIRYIPLFLFLLLLNLLLVRRPRFGVPGLSQIQQLNSGFKIHKQESRHN